MAFDSVPWLVDGGAVHSAEVSRTLPSVLSGDAEGVSSFGALKVSASPTPDNRVRAAAGACLIRNTYGSESDQSYVGRNAADDYVTIAPTSGVGRSDMIVVRIDDPQYGGTTPVDVTVGPYIFPEVISNVGSTATKASELGLDYPAIALARIDIPPSTATITNAMITDVRKVARPRKDRELLTYYPSGDLYLSAASPTAANWPKAAGWDVEIPEWATKLIVIGQLGGIDFETPGGRGFLRVRLGTDGSLVETQTTAFDSTDAPGRTRPTLLAAGEITIPAAYRGTTQTLAVRGSLNAGTGTQRPQADTASTVIVDLEFVEDPSVA